MPSTYTLNNGIELIGTGEQSGTWGDTTNTNLGLLDVALDGQVTVALASAGSSGSPNSLPISDGTASNGRNRMVVFSDSGDLGATAYVQLTPNDAEKIIYIRNSLSGSRAVILFQGTYNASNDYEVPAGTTAVVYFDGAGAGAVAANVFNNAHFDALNVVGAASIGSLVIAGTAVTATAAELNILDGVTATAAELNILDGVTATAAELNLLDGSIAGTVVNSKAVIYGAAGQVEATTVEFDNLSGTGAVSVTNILDEDNMASNSATALATQQSIKAYVDAQVDTVDTLAEILAIGNTTGGTDIVASTTDKVQFRDAAIYINSSVDGQLDIVADTEIQIAATTVDLNGNLDVSGTLGVTGVLTATSLDISGDIDVDGTTNLDVVDIDGAVDMASTLLVTGVLTTTAATVSNGGGQFNGAINVGVDDTGYDVKFFGATTGKSLLWDESADSLIVTGTTTLVGTTNLDAVDIDGATQIDATVTVGVNDTGYDVKFFGATAGAYMLWDESADDLILGGAAGLSVNSAALVTGVLTTTAATVSNGGGQFNGAINVGVNDTGYDVKFFGATTGKSLLWDESADSLIVTGTTTLVGTTNLDAVDIDGATQIDATVTVGVDDTGYDVKFFGATAGKYMLWDESADTLEVSGTVVAGAGTALLPSITTTGDLNTGMWFPAADTIAFSEGGVEALRIDSSGNVGIGTSSPSTKLEVSDGAITAGSSGQVLIGRNSASFPSPGAGYFSLDTNNTDGSNGGVSFKTLSSDVLTERMRIDSSGNLLVGTTTSGFGNDNGFSVENVSIVQRHVNGTSAGTQFTWFVYNGGAIGDIAQSGTTGVSYNTSSDYRLKTDAQPMTGASARVQALNPVNFEWIADGTRVDGFLAHEAQEVVPEAVTGTKDAMRDEQYEVTAAVEATYDEDSNELTAAVPAVMGTRSVPDYQGIDQSKLVPLLTAALQEALTKIADMEIRLSTLEG
jgi:cytoskeletal protein CcmA (bactofilin family)